MKLAPVGQPQIAPRVPKPGLAASSIRMEGSCHVHCCSADPGRVRPTRERRSPFASSMAVNPMELLPVLVELATQGQRWIGDCSVAFGSTSPSAAKLSCRRREIDAASVETVAE